LYSYIINNCNNYLIILFKDNFILYNKLNIFNIFFIPCTYKILRVLYEEILLMSSCVNDERIFFNFLLIIPI